MRLRPSLPILSAAGLVLLPSAALAHPGHDHVASFMTGALHPLSGLDHILAMVVVGLFAVQIGGRALWALPASFIIAMALGGAAGASGGTLAFVELGIVASVALLVAMVVLRLRPSMLAAMALAGVAGLFHGHAHGAEAAGSLSALYLAGVLLSTAALQATGIAAGLVLRRVLPMDGPRLATRRAGR